MSPLLNGAIINYRASTFQTFRLCLMQRKWSGHGRTGRTGGYAYGNEDYAREQSSLECRFQLSRTIPGARKLHSFVLISDSTVEVNFTHHLMFPGKRE